MLSDREMVLNLPLKRLKILTESTWIRLFGFPKAITTNALSMLWNANNLKPPLRLWSYKVKLAEMRRILYAGESAS